MLKEIIYLVCIREKMDPLIRAKHGKNYALEALLDIHKIFMSQINVKKYISALKHKNGKYGLTITLS